jgi:hypothetical protein
MVCNISLPLKLVSGRVGISISLMLCLGWIKVCEEWKMCGLGMGTQNHVHTIILWVYNGYMLP